VEKARQPVAAVPWAKLAGEGGHGATEGESQWDLHLRGGTRWGSHLGVPQVAAVTG
jgi:hypothetical protein